MKKTLTIISFAILSVIAATAQTDSLSQTNPDPSQGLSLSLKEAQQYALEHNRSLKNASLDVKKSQASKWQAIASMLPQINASAGYSQSFDADFSSFKVMTFEMPATGTLSLQASIAVSGTQVVAAKLGKIAEEMSDITLSKSEQETKDQIKTLYYSALVLEKTLSLLNENLTNIKKLHHLTETSVEVGIAEQTDADQLLVQVASMETSINAQKSTLEMAYNSMRLNLGVDAGTPIHLTQGIDDLLNVESVANLLGEEFILDNNYNYQLLKKSTELSKQQLNSAMWSCTPTLSAYYQYSTLTHFGADAVFNMNAPHSVGATLSIPVFTSLSKTKGVQAAKISYEEQLNTFDETEQSLLLQHSQYCFNLANAFETYNTQVKNLEVTQRIFDNLSNKYKLGAASSLDLTNSSNNLVSAQSTYVQALLALVNAQISLEQLLNKQ